MNTTLTRREWLAAAAALSAASFASAKPADDSIYALPLALTDQTGATTPLAARRGSPLVVSMFYTSCAYVCPMLVEAIRANEQKLSAEERARLRVLLVTFDPETDTVAVLRKTADARRVDDKRWTLARTDAASVRKLAALLGIQYRAIGKGDFNHSTVLVAVDADGRIAGRTTELSGADPAFVKTLKRTLSPA
jgi:protein SCO1